MSNRIYDRVWALEKQSVHLYGSFVVGASGAVGTVKGLGIKSVTKETTAGQYTIELEDYYPKFLHFDCKVILGSANAVASVQLFATPANFQSGFIADKKFTIQCLGFAGAAGNPDSGAYVEFEVIVRRTTVGPA